MIEVQEHVRKIYTKDRRRPGRRDVSPELVALLRQRRIDQQATKSNHPVLVMFGVSFMLWAVIVATAWLIYTF